MDSDDTNVDDRDDCTGNVMLLAAGHLKCLKMMDKMSVAGKIINMWCCDVKKVAD